MTALSFPFAGHSGNTVVQTSDGTEYFAVKVNPKNLVVISLEDGRPLQGPHNNFTFVRLMDPADLGRRFALEDQWAVNPKNPRHKTEATSTTGTPAPPLPKLGLGVRVRLVGTRAFGKFPTDVDYVVIGVNAKTYNIVPLGGFGDGTEYAQVSPGYLTLVEEPGN